LGENLSIDLDHFKEMFITESFELLEEMEERLIGLDEGEPDLDEVNAIFRCAHSIKGGGGAFGFSQLVSFTHILEALLDGMREGDLRATQEVIDALLSSVDIVSQMVIAAQEGTVMPNDFGSELAEKLKEIASGSRGAETLDLEREADVPVIQAESAVKEVELYGVDFAPHRSLLASGNEPLFIIRELMRCGDVEARIDYSAIPTLDAIDVEECYVKWALDVSTDQGKSLIEEAFEFVEDDCDLTIEGFGGINLPDVDGFKNDEFGGLFDGALGALDVPPVADLENATVKAPSSESADGKPTVKKVAGAGKAGVSTIRVDIDKVDNLVNMVGELVITQAMIINHTKDLGHEQFHDLLQGVEELSRHTRELQESVMSVRMQPVKSVFARMPRIVRDLSRQLEKNIKIEMHGEMTEIDKTVVEQLGDPLTHMIRNSVDHGIEKPDVREKNGKPREGTIKLSADNAGGRILIEISDDGAGINRERVLAKAIEKDVVSSDASLSDEEIDNLIFAAGFSTADEVTDVSGRGVGMDVVRRNIADLGGAIELFNEPGRGSRFLVSLPLTLAILDGMIVRIGAEDYIIPISNSLESMKPHEGDIKHVSGGKDVINVRGEFVPILYLKDLLGVTSENQRKHDALVVLVENGRDKIGLVVDELIGQQQVVIKSIEENAESVEGVSGATILGNGRVSLILDISGLDRLATQTNKPTLAA
jgi:two-component system chemotaxis sensor kinase CheA